MPRVPRDILRIRATQRTRRQWMQAFRVLRVKRPGITADRVAGEAFRSLRLKLVRLYGASEVARILGEAAPKEKGAPFTGPPDRPRNVR